MRLILPKKPPEQPPPPPLEQPPSVTRQESPTWECEHGVLPDVDAEAPLSEPDTRQSQNAQAPRWKPWQDRELISEVDIIRPFAETSATAVGEAWSRVASELLRKSKPGSLIDRTASACRSRFERLVVLHKVSAPSPHFDTR